MVYVAAVGLMVVAPETQQALTGVRVPLHAHPVDDLHTVSRRVAGAFNRLYG